MLFRSVKEEVGELVEAVEESDNDKFKKGDEVILTGWRVGEIYFGGYSQYAKVNGEFLVKKPKTLSSREAMVIGRTANIMDRELLLFQMD